MTTLRERLEARRQRIKAGLPPPDAVTVTAAFLDGMVPVEPRQCIVPECGAMFTPRNKSQVTCGSDACVRARHNAQQSKTQRKGPLEPRICAVEGCNREFVPRRSSYKTCGSERCKETYRRRKSAEHRQAYEQRKREAA